MSVITLSANMVWMVLKMPKTKTQHANPVVPAGALKIPVFEEVRQGQFVFVGYVADESDTEWIWMKRAA